MKEDISRFACIEVALIGFILRWHGGHSTFGLHNPSRVTQKLAYGTEVYDEYDYVYTY